MQDTGKIVAMVASRSTTPPPWSQADLGLSMGTGSDVAIEASNLTLIRGDLRAGS